MKLRNLFLSTFIFMAFSSFSFAETSNKNKSDASQAEKTTTTTETTTAPDGSVDGTKTTSTTERNQEEHRNSEDEKKDNTEKKGFFLEPALTYETGEATLSYPAPYNSSKEKVRGFGLGLRLGAHIHDVVFLALDGRYSRPKFNSEALDSSSNSSAYNAGLTLGLQTPVAGLRIWGTYILAGDLNPETYAGVDPTFTNLRGYRLGAGLYVASFSVNLEYQNAKYHATNLDAVGPFTAADSDRITADHKAYIASISFPIAF